VGFILTAFARAREPIVLKVFFFKVEERKVDRVVVKNVFTLILGVDNPFATHITIGTGNIGTRVRIPSRLPAATREKRLNENPMLGDSQKIVDDMM
jgi:hypothetical protein